MPTVYLGLGSNLGDRAAMLRAAAAALPPHVALTRWSSLYDTAPQLIEDQPRFLNAAVCGITTLEPHQLLRAVKDIEQSLGRVPGPRYGPRAIDIDLLLYDDLVLSSDTLVIPHPHLPERAFVLVPLAEIAPELPIAGLHQTVSALAARVLGSDGVRRIGPLVTDRAVPYNADGCGQAT
jgi:2-amino-4-hydroxy-6-hydroxymethyldihydropteridine diphosphokinase